eukprot:TRINITY_DN18208_c0_g1_i1.p1 TRINITY_DN18208_c0_g1~~TRINITY_DN18208_c0_g1_i1.p1  ORF type:complete len:134 (+),score=6.48 TRINITY_DN18208_c0_g1_i1:314-715(+)
MAVVGSFWMLHEVEILELQFCRGMLCQHVCSAVLLTGTMLSWERGNAGVVGGVHLASVNECWHGRRGHCGTRGWGQPALCCGPADRTRWADDKEGGFPSVYGTITTFSRMFFQDGLTGSAWGDWALYTASPLR